MIKKVAVVSIFALLLTTTLSQVNSVDAKDATVLARPTSPKTRPSPKPKPTSPKQSLTSNEVTYSGISRILSLN